MIPITRAEFKTFCMEQLGYPTIQIEVTEKQVDNRVDFALRKFMDYHYEGTEKQYYPFQIRANNFSTAIYSVAVANGGNGYSNSDVIVWEGTGHAANATINTNADGTIVAINLTDNGRGFGVPPTPLFKTAAGANSAGVNASLTVELGGFVPLPDNIIGVVDLFAVGNRAGANDLFNLRYQIVLNDLYMFNNLNIVPFVTAMYNIAQIEEVLVGKQPIRYNRYKGRLYIDMDWSVVSVGEFIVMVAYSVIDPDVYTKVWSDPWLQKYAVAQIKEQWGNALKKYGNQALVGGYVFNGKEIYDEARAEIKELDDELKDSWFPLPTDFMG